MRRLVLALAILLLVSPRAWAAPVDIEDYKGADAGTVVVALAALGVADITLELERVDGTGRLRVRAQPGVSLRQDLKGMFDEASYRRALEVDCRAPRCIRNGSTYRGEVKAIRLPPGRYRVASITITRSGGLYVVRSVTSTIRPGAEFDVSAGAGVYLGRLLAVPSTVGEFWRVAVIDARNEDLGIARTRGAPETRGFQGLEALVAASNAAPYIE